LKKNPDPVPTILHLGPLHLSIFYSVFGFE
jgi:hypothetical protein